MKPSSSEQSLLTELLEQALSATETIIRRVKAVNTVDDFFSSESGMEKLDSLCMQLIALGEILKKIDKITLERLLVKYPEVNWKNAKGMRDIITHHYFDIDAETVLKVCRTHIPTVNKTLQKIKKDQQI